MMPGATAPYEEALDTGAPSALLMRTADGRTLPMEVHRWCSRPDAVDARLLQRCRGPVIDVGCGPGRLTLALAERGVPALGVDIARAAVARARQSGVPVLHQSVFSPLPGEGQWGTVLLADGNIGIGGHPVSLLHRCAELVRPDGGQILIEAEPVDIDERLTARLEHGGRHGPEFAWARLGTPAVVRAAANTDLTVTDQWQDSGRAFVHAARTR